MRFIGLMKHAGGWVAGSAWHSAQHIQSRSEKLPDRLDSVAAYIDDQRMNGFADIIVIIEWQGDRQPLMEVVKWCRGQQIGCYAVSPRALHQALIRGAGRRWDVELMAISALMEELPLCIPERMPTEDDRLREFRDLVRQRVDAFERRNHQGNPQAPVSVRRLLENQYQLAVEEVESCLKQDDEGLHRVAALRQIPGVTYLDALVILAETQAIDLRGKKAFYAYCGLVPVERMSGEPWDSEYGNQRLRTAFHRIGARRMRIERVSVQGIQERAKCMSKAARKAAKAVYGLLTSWQNAGDTARLQ